LIAFVCLGEKVKVLQIPERPRELKNKDFKEKKPVISTDDLAV
jgi:hypothetical protein